MSLPTLHPFFQALGPAGFLAGSPAVPMAYELAVEDSALDSAALEADLDLARRCLDGDGESYRIVVERYQSRIAAIMRRFTSDAGAREELVQDAFVEAYTSLSTYKGKAPLEHWLSRIATRVGYAYWKRLARERSRRSVSIEDMHDRLSAPVEEMSPDEALEILEAVLDQLPPRDRLIVTLRYVEGLSVEEAADMSGWSPAMVKVQCWRAKNKLRKLLNERLGE